MHISDHTVSVQTSTVVAYPPLCQILCAEPVTTPYTGLQSKALTSTGDRRAETSGEMGMGVVPAGAARAVTAGDVPPDGVSSGDAPANGVLASTPAPPTLSGSGVTDGPVAEVAEGGRS